MVTDLQVNVVAAIEGAASQLPTSPAGEENGGARGGGALSPPKTKYTVQHRKKDKIVLEVRWLRSY